MITAHSKNFGWTAITIFLYHRTIISKEHIYWTAFMSTMHCGGVRQTNVRQLQTAVKNFSHQFC